MGARINCLRPLRSTSFFRPPLTPNPSPSEGRGASDPGSLLPLPCRREVLLDLGGVLSFRVAAEGVFVDGDGLVGLAAGEEGVAQVHAGVGVVGDELER